MTTKFGKEFQHHTRKQVRKLKSSFRRLAAHPTVRRSTTFFEKQRADSGTSLPSASLTIRDAR